MDRKYQLHFYLDSELISKIVLGDYPRVGEHFQLTNGTFGQVAHVTWRYDEESCPNMRLDIYAEGMLL